MKKYILILGFDLSIVIKMIFDSLDEN